MQGQDFLVQLLAKLDTTSVNKDYEKIKKQLTSDPFIQKLTFDTSMSKQAIKEMSSKIHNELAKAFKQSGIDSFNITVKDVESILSSAVHQSNKLSQELDKAASNAQKFLARFNNKTGGTLINSSEFKEVEKAIEGLGNTHSIDQLNRSMNTLETTYNNIVSNLRSGSKSLNPFINAITDMNNMDSTLRNIGLEFEKLSTKPQAVSDSIKQLSVLQKEVNQYPQGTVEWAQAYGNLKKTINSVNAELKNLSKTKSASVSTQVFNIGDLEKQGVMYFTKARNTIEKMLPSIKSKFNDAGFSNISVKGIEDASGKIKSFTVIANDAEGALKKFNFEREKLKGSGKAQYGFIQSDSVQVIKTAAKAQDELLSKLEKSNVNSTQIDKLQAQFQKYGLSVEEAEDKVRSLRETLATIQSSSGIKLDSAFENWKVQIKDVRVQLDQAKLSFDKFAQPVSTDKISSLSIKIQNFLEKNTAITKSAKIQLKDYINELDGGNISLGRWNEINTEFAKTESHMRTLKKLGKSLKDQLAQAASSFTQWISVSSVIMTGVYQTKEAITELKELDTILTEISKTSDLTVSSLKELGNTSFESASKYGRKASDYLSGVQEMYRAGFNNSEELADLSVLAQSAGDMSKDLANKYLIATDAAYKLNGSVESLNHVLDGQNYITNKNALNMSDLAEATKVAASQAAGSGVEVDKLTAAVGTMIATTQQGGDIAGRAFKGILMNIQQVKGVTEDGDIIDDESLKKVESTCKDVGVALKEVKDGVVMLRDPMEVLKELSEAYRSMDKMDARRAQIISDIGGKYRGNQLSALLEGWDKYEKMLTEFSQGSGSAMEEAMKSANNWEGSLNRLSNTWTDIVGNIANSDGIISGINTLNNLLTVVNKVTDSLGTFGTAAVGVGAALSAKNAGKTFLFLLT